MFTAATSATTEQPSLRCNSHCVECLRCLFHCVFGCGFRLLGWINWSGSSSTASVYYIVVAESLFCFYSSTNLPQTWFTTTSATDSIISMCHIFGSRLEGIQFTTRFIATSAGSLVRRPHTIANLLREEQSRVFHKYPRFLCAIFLEPDSKAFNPQLDSSRLQQSDWFEDHKQSQTYCAKNNRGFFINILAPTHLERLLFSSFHHHDFQ